MQMTSHCRKCGRVMTSERIETCRVRMSCTCGFSDFRAMPDTNQTANPFYREARFIPHGEMEKGKQVLFMRRAGREHREIITLEEISLLVSSDAELPDLLCSIAAKLAAQLNADVCNIYLREGEELVLKATRGFDQEHVGKIRLKIGEGITGAVARQMRPLNLSSAWRDPRFKVFPELNEEKYNAMLSFPITDETEVYGVINLQMTSVRHFKEDEIQFVSIIAYLILSALKLRRN
ncbi:MAG: histidine kinase [Geobacteraceae bacterium GWC2_58_44]|nr:MAG: histidine kinase [Geobacteraceae bacterium GWC2_58_44]HBG06042.1 GAF domain-containing protein [Geobacter sp.]